MFFAVRPLKFNLAWPSGIAKDKAGRALSQHAIPGVEPPAWRGGAVPVGQAHRSAQALGQARSGGKRHPDAALLRLAKVVVRLAKRLRRDNIDSSVAIEIPHDCIEILPEDRQSAPAGIQCSEHPLPLAKQDQSRTGVQSAEVRSNRVPVLAEKQIIEAVVVKIRNVDC